MTRRIIVATVTVALLSFVAAACAGSTAVPVTIAPASPPAPASTPPPVSSTQVPAATSSVAASTLPVSSTTATTVLPPGVVGLSPDGPWKLVDSAPGVTTPGLVYELMPKLWVFLPTEESRDDGNLFVPAPDDIPIIEAYLQARLVFFRATESNPISLEDPGWAAYYSDRGESYFTVLRPRLSEGQHFDRDLGVVLRPYVLGEGRSDTDAIVFDCMLDGGVWRFPNGSLSPTAIPGVAPNGLSARISMFGDRWITDGVANQPEACA
jgi:hypothetical protein